MSKLIKAILGFGPGIFAIGYTIGTGSVTAMIVAGSTYGMQLLWVLLLSCLFSGALIYAYGNFALVTGETALHAFRKYLPYGNVIGIAIIVGVTFGQWNSLIGILGISSNIIFELLALYFPALSQYKYGVVIAIAAVVISVHVLDTADRPVFPVRKGARVLCEHHGGFIHCLAGIRTPLAR